MMFSEVSSTCPDMSHAVLLPAGFEHPPGLAPPPGLLPPPGFASFAGKNSLSIGDDLLESDADCTSTGSSSLLELGSSEHDETEPDETKELESLQLNTYEPMYVPCSMTHCKELQRTPLVPGLQTAGCALVPGLQPRSSLQLQQRTPLKKSAEPFVPLPFVPMAKVEETWQHWHSQKEHQEGNATETLPLPIGLSKKSKGRASHRRY